LLRVPGWPFGQGIKPEKAYASLRITGIKDKARGGKPVSIRVSHSITMLIAHQYVNNQENNKVLEKTGAFFIKSPLV
jgi:hypothetical protein